MMSPAPNLPAEDELCEKEEKVDDSYEVDGSGEISSSDKEARPAWDNKVQYMMAALGFAVGLGNVWRFPYLCKKNGGGAFLIPYIVMLLIEGYPLYYLELALGQKIRKGSIGVWIHINPYLGGVGFASNVVSLIIGLYYNMILGWAMFYLFNSFQSPLPWATCPTYLNSTVRECAISSTTNYFWYRETLDISHTIADGGEQNWRMVCMLLLAWILVYLGINKGIKSSGKVMYFATSFPYLVLIAFFIRGLTLDGAVEGVKYMFSPDITRLKDADVWREAATQIFFSLGLGYGSIIAYSSYNPPKNNCYKDAVFIATANCLTSIFACVTVFSVLGFKAKSRTLECLESNRLLFKNFPEYQIFSNMTYHDINSTLNLDPTNETSTFLQSLKPCSMQRELDQDVQGTGLAFIAFTEAILKFPAAPFWSVLFFFMLLNIGMSSEFGILQTFVTTVLDSGLKISKSKLTALMCVGMFVVGLLFTQRSGSYFLDIFDAYSATLSLITIALFEVVAVSYVYGIKRFEKDLLEMTGVKPGLYWTISWRFTCPLALAAILVASIVGLFRKAPSYGGWNQATGEKDLLNFPPWGLALIVALVLASVACIPIVAFLYHRGIFKPERFDPSRKERSKLEEEFTGTESAQPLTRTL
ncbi:sodium-dependent neutral amino acid transporter SLC6A17-like [Clavelina lepadiformis]|uniref:sodium-dependent neutral amino acid transporter SLC6A17-like n=1 Tax=Clavelina lepadiformis TaxID=159417 RepID=UPI00404247DA